MISRNGMMSTTHITGLANMSDAKTITELDKEEAKKLLINAIFIILMMTLGIIGNLVVLVVYGFRMKSSNHRTYILFLCGIDLSASTVAMPFAVVIFREPFNHATSVFCKVYWFLNYFLASASALTLLVIAVERYRKVCVPFGRQMSRKLVIKLCGIVLLIALSLAWPGAAYIDARSTHVGSPAVNVTLCANERGEVYKSSMIYYHCFLTFVVFSSLFVLAILYTLILRAVQKCKNCSDINSRLINKPLERANPSNIEDDSDISVKQSTETRTSSGYSRMSKNKRRLTLMFFLITIKYAVSFIPYLVLMILKNVGIISQLSIAERILYNLVISLVYVNNVTNCFIYSCFDVRFRYEFKALFAFCKTPRI